MNAGRHIAAPQHNQTDNRVAIGRPEGAGHVTFGEAAEQMLENGYEPLPIVPGEKRPAPSRWSSVRLDPERINDWQCRFRDHGIGLRTGHLVGLDIDDLDPDRAHAAQDLVERRVGATLVRVGQWPKRLLLYRTDQPFAKLKSGKIEILGAGQQFVAFGLHKATGRPYYWTTGETPMEVCLDDLPVLTRESAAAFLAEIGPPDPSVAGRTHARHRPKSQASDGPVRDSRGRVTDGRDAWLSRIAFHAVHDALEAGGTPDGALLAAHVWQRFSDSTDLARPRQDGDEPYASTDALRKVQDKLRLARQGRLPPRDNAVPEPDFEAPTLSVAEGRAQLADLVNGFCEQVQDWHTDTIDAPPQIGIRATVGIGKSRVAREHLLALATSLRDQGLPHRILVFTASHALAEETAEAWRADGAHVAVLRGYERKDPVTGTPMCRDLEAVQAALAARLRVPRTVCIKPGKTRCRFFDTCLKQRNRQDVAEADVVVAPYDALFSGLAFKKDDVALLLIDEGCWARALEQKAGVYIEEISNELISGMGKDTIGRGPVAAMADLVAFREQVARALAANGPGPVSRAALLGEGLTMDACEHAASLEFWRLTEPELVPGLTGKKRHDALRVAFSNARIYTLASYWQVLGQFLDQERPHSGMMRVRPSDVTGRHDVTVRRVRRLHDSLRGKPVLHLDATMRPDLAHTILPALDMVQIDVAAPHMHLRMVSGSFGKSTLCPASGLAPEEARRRANRLQECVDYVRWHAQRVCPHRVLVATYQSIEDAFVGISNVEVAHFNAVAGLDCYRDVALLISIGRPLPPSQELEALTGAYFDHVPQGRYRREHAGLRMRSGMTRGIPVLLHEDEQAETLRAAICDDELIQVVGRGRGVNRTAADPLEVHFLADVALPLVVDCLTTWDVERPDVFQKMLLAGIAVNSPADAAVLHPELFGNGHQAKMAFERGAFKAQNPINNSYREMCLKSAAYRRAGRGRGWQRAWWNDGDAETVGERLKSVLGDLAEWRPG